MSWEEREGSRPCNGDGRNWKKYGSMFIYYVSSFPHDNKDMGHEREHETFAVFCRPSHGTYRWIRPLQIKRPTSTVIASAAQNLLIAAVDMDCNELFFELQVADMGGLPIHSHCAQVNISLILTQITLTMCSHTWGGGHHHKDMFLQWNELWPSCEPSSSSVHVLPSPGP